MSDILLTMTQITRTEVIENVLKSVEERLTAFGPSYSIEDCISTYQVEYEMTDKVTAYYEVEYDHNKGQYRINLQNVVVKA